MLRPDEQAIKERAQAATDKQRPLLRGDELKALEIHERIPGSSHACPPWILERLEEARGKLEAVREWRKQPSPKSWRTLDSLLSGFDLDRILRSEEGNE